MQQITFTDHILFESDRYKINATGQQALQSVGDALRQQISSIQEIQIQGHADTEPTRMFSSNLELAALRAIEVYSFLQAKCGIDPTENLMSATSFGEFKPVSRTEYDTGYDSEQLKKDNDNDLKRSKNRRIEMLLFYKNS
jgi:flagellar motor protein MotB